MMFNGVCFVVPVTPLYGCTQHFCFCFSPSLVVCTNYSNYAQLSPTSASSQRYKNLRQRPQISCSCLSKWLSCLTVIFWYACCTKILTDFSFSFLFFTLYCNGLRYAMPYDWLIDWPVYTIGGKRTYVHCLATSIDRTRPIGLLITEKEPAVRVLYSERELDHVHVRYMLSPVRLYASVVCNVRAPYTQPVQIFGNISTPFGTVAIHRHSQNILWRLSLPWKTPLSWGLNAKGVTKYSDFGLIESHISETVQDRR